MLYIYVHTRSILFWNSICLCLKRKLCLLDRSDRNVSNLSTGERQALYEFRSDRNIAIKGADKSLAVVVWD